MQKSDLIKLDELIILDIASTGYAYAQRCQSICLAHILAEQAIDTKITLVVLGPDERLIQYNIDQFGLSNQVDVIGVEMAGNSNETARRLKQAGDQRRGCRIDDAKVKIIESPQVKDILMAIANEDQHAKYGLNIIDYGDNGRRMMPPKRIRLTAPIDVQNDMAKAVQVIREKRLRSWLIDHDMDQEPNPPITMLDLMISYWKDESDMMNPDAVWDNQLAHSDQMKKATGRRMSVGYDNIAHAIGRLEKWCAGQPQPICLNLINGQHTADASKKKKQIDKAFANVGVKSEVAFLTDLFGEKPHLREDTCSRLAFIQALPKSSMVKILDQDVMVKGMHLGQGDALKHFHVHLNDGLANKPTNNSTAPLCVVCHDDEIEQGGYWADLAHPDSPLINYTITDKDPDHIVDQIIQTIIRTD